MKIINIFFFCQHSAVLKDISYLEQRQSRERLGKKTDFIGKHHRSNGKCQLPLLIKRKAKEDDQFRTY